MLYSEIGSAGFGAPDIASTALECTPSAAIITSPVTMVPEANVIELPSWSCHDISLGIRP
jgi:hypothetical protein